MLARVLAAVRIQLLPFDVGVFLCFVLFLVRKLGVLGGCSKAESPPPPHLLRNRWLVKGAKAGDSLFMHYSGHGGSVKDHTGDEEDQKDETMVPVDYAKSGQIKDDEILEEVRGYTDGGTAVLGVVFFSS